MVAIVKSGREAVLNAGCQVHFVSGFVAGSFYGVRVRVLKRNGRAGIRRAGRNGRGSSGDREPRGRIAGN